MIIYIHINKYYICFFPFPHSFLLRVRVSWFRVAAGWGWRGHYYDYGIINQIIKLQSQSTFIGIGFNAPLASNVLQVYKPAAFLGQGKASPTWFLLLSTSCQTPMQRSKARLAQDCFVSFGSAVAQLMLWPLDPTIPYPSRDAINAPKYATESTYISGQIWSHDIPLKAQILSCLHPACPNCDYLLFIFASSWWCFNFCLNLLAMARNVPVLTTCSR